MPTNASKTSHSDPCHQGDAGRGSTLPQSFSPADYLWGDIVVLCAEKGMGKTHALMGLARYHSNKGDKVRIEDLERMLPEEAVVRIAELGRWAGDQARRGKNFLFVCDNVPAFDESQLQTCVTALRKMASSGGIVALGMLPEASALAEALGEARRFWSCDLIVSDMPGNALDEALVRETHAIPGLLSAVAKMNRSEAGTLLGDLRFQEAFVELVSGSFRTGLIGEELRLRLVLLLMGRGTAHDVTLALGQVDPDMWRYLARDAPLFGIDVAQSTFRCVGTYEADGLNVVYSILRHVAAPFSHLVLAVARFLAGAGEYVRSAIVATICSDPLQRCAFLLEYAAEFINVGEAEAVCDAVDKAREEGWVGLRGIGEAQLITAALRGERVAGEDGHDPVTTWAPHDKGGLAGLVMWSLDLLGTAPQLIERRVGEGEGALCKALALHGNSLVRILRGETTKAYDALLDTPWRHDDSTVASALLQIDYLICSFMAGIVPSRDDVELWRATCAFLDRSGIALLASLGDMIVPIGLLLAGCQCMPSQYETRIHHAQRLGLDVAQALLLLVAALGDLRGGALTKAHVRLERCMSLFTKAGTQVEAGAAHILDIAVRAQLGEHIDKRELLSCRGLTVSVDRVVTVVSAALQKEPRGGRPVGSGRWGSSRCPESVYWLVNALMSDFGSFSKRFRSVMPPLWRDGVSRASNEVDMFFEQLRAPLARRSPAASAGAVAGPSGEADEATRIGEGPAVRITLLGGLEVRVRGKLVPIQRLERRRAKSLLAILVAVPGHAVRRFIIMETIWPEYDYRKAGKCVYSATSVLRSELVAASGDTHGPAIVLSNKAEGTLALNVAHIECDVDQLEEKAHVVLDNEGRDRLVISLCREIEDLYRGDMFVPVTDGMGFLQDRARALRSLFADAMVAGSVAATHLGMRMLACRFADRAHRADPLREDAVEALMVAFCAAGRYLEAEGIYEKYVGEASKRTRKPPSKHLRETVHGLLNDAARTGSDGQLRFEFGEDGETS